MTKKFRSLFEAIVDLDKEAVNYLAKGKTPPDRGMMQCPICKYWHDGGGTYCSPECRRKAL